MILIMFGREKYNFLQTKTICRLGIFMTKNLYVIILINIIWQSKICVYFTSVKFI